jgi:isoleucyl-tRNA synthetase
MRDTELVVLWERLIKVRDRVLAEIEPLRKDKQIGSSLQAKVVLSGGGDEMVLLKDHLEELPMLFIVSEVELRPTNDAGVQVTIEKTAGVKCERCWRYVPTVSTDPGRPGICDRCQDALAEAVNS